MDQLTPREFQVAMLVARGLTNKEIARQLGLSIGTVKLHVHNILRKLGATKRYAIFRLPSRSDNRDRGLGPQDVSRRPLASKLAI
jgi:DNA-binding NarL/FixJ family response regulator